MFFSCSFLLFRIIVFLVLNANTMEVPLLMLLGNMGKFCFLVNVY